MPMVNHRHQLPDGREIDVGLQLRGRRARLTAHLVKHGLIAEVMRCDFAYDGSTIDDHIAVFATAFESLVKTSIPRPLLQANHRVCDDVIVTGPPS